MANHITLYNYDGDNRVISKTLANGTSFTSVVYRDSVDFHSPVFSVESNVSPDLNYAEIEQDGSTRYYFARVENVRNNLSLIHCFLDVLMTYKTEILETYCICKRTANMNYQCQYIVDAKAPIEAKHNISQIENATELAHLSSSLILCTVG